MHLLTSNNSDSSKNTTHRELLKVGKISGSVVLAEVMLPGSLPMIRTDGLR